MNKKEFRALIREEVRKVLREAYRDPQDNINILKGMMKKGGNEASMVKDILLDLKSEYNVTLDLTNNQSIAAAISNKEVADYLDNAVEDALDNGLGRMKTNVRPSNEGTQPIDLKKIQASKPGDMVTVQSDWSPSGTKMVQVKILEPFKKIKGSDYIGAIADYKGRLERVTIDNEEQTAFIGGNWEDEYDESYLDALATKYKLKR